MTFPGQRKQHDYSAKTAFKTVGLMVGVGVLLIGCVAGIAALGGGSGDEPDVIVSATADRAGVGQLASTTPPPAATTPAAATSEPAPTTKPPVSKKPPAPKTTKPKPPPPPDDEPDDVYYANCAEVRAAGAAPLHRGEPGYRSGLDRDGDGVACES